MVIGDDREGRGGRLPARCSGLDLVVLTLLGIRGDRQLGGEVAVGIGGHGDGVADRSAVRIVQLHGHLGVGREVLARDHGAVTGGEAVGLRGDRRGVDHLEGGRCGLAGGGGPDGRELPGLGPCRNRQVGGERTGLIRGDLDRLADGVAGRIGQLHLDRGIGREVPAGDGGGRAILHRGGICGERGLDLGRRAGAHCRGREVHVHGVQSGQKLQAHGIDRERFITEVAGGRLLVDRHRDDFTQDVLEDRIQGAQQGVDQSVHRLGEAGRGRLQDAVDRISERIDELSHHRVENGIEHRVQGNAQEIATDLDRGLTGRRAGELAECGVDDDVHVRRDDADQCADLGRDLDSQADVVEQILLEDRADLGREGSERLGHCSRDQADGLGIQQFGVRRQPVQAVCSAELLEIHLDGAVHQVDRDEPVRILQRLIEEGVAGFVEGDVEAGDPDRAPAGLHTGHQRNGQVDVHRVRDPTERTLGAHGIVQHRADVGHCGVEVGGECADQRRADHQMAVGEHVLGGDVITGGGRSGSDRAELDGELIDDLIGEPVDAGLAEQVGDVHRGRAVGSVGDAIEVDSAPFAHRTGAGHRVLTVGARGVARQRAGLAEMEESTFRLGAQQRKADTAQVNGQILVQGVDVERAGVRTGIAREPGLAGARVREVEVEHIGVEDSPLSLGEIGFDRKGRGYGQ